MAFTRSTMRLVLAMMAWSFVACASSEDGDTTITNPYIAWRQTIELPAGSPTPVHEDGLDCLTATTDEERFHCAESEFWRVFQRDISERETVWQTMFVVGEQLTLGADPIEHARFLFQRAQLSMAIVLEQKQFSVEDMATMPQSDLKLLASMSSDIEDAIILNPNEPFYVTWLDTLKIATADRLEQWEMLDEVLVEAWANLEDYNKHTTRSSLIASLTGTTVALSMASGGPQKTIEILEAFECHPQNLMKNPDALCGVGDTRDCASWCLANSLKAPFGGPGMMYHMGESYARLGDTEEARRFYEFALTLPGADVWPYRTKVEEALGDMDSHVGQFTALKDDESATYLAYTNGSKGCVLCHGQL